MGILMSIEFYRESPGKSDSRTLSRETLSRQTGRIHDKDNALCSKCYSPFLGFMLGLLVGRLGVFHNSTFQQPRTWRGGPRTITLPCARTPYTHSKPYVYIYIYIYIYTHSSLSIFLSIYLELHVYCILRVGIHTCCINLCPALRTPRRPWGSPTRTLHHIPACLLYIHICMCVYIYTHMYVYIYIYTCICVYIYIYIYRYSCIHKLP